MTGTASPLKSAAQSLSKAWRKISFDGTISKFVIDVAAKSKGRLTIMVDDIQFDLQRSSEAACSGDRRALVTEYETYGIGLRPVCRTATSSARPAGIGVSYANLIGDQNQIRTWGLLRDPLIRGTQWGGNFGLTGWVKALGLSKAPRINSGYRDPFNNIKIQGSSKAGRHMFGDAIDLRVTGGKDQWCAFNKAALIANADYIEGPFNSDGSKNGCFDFDKEGVLIFKCAHADWRYHVGPFRHGKSDDATQSIAAYAGSAGSSPATHTAVAEAHPDQIVPIPLEADQEIDARKIAALREQLTAAARLREIDGSYNDVYLAVLHDLSQIRHPSVLELFANEDLIGTGNVVVSGLTRQGASAVQKLAPLYIRTRNPVARMAIHMVYGRLLAMGALAEFPSQYLSVRRQLLAGTRDSDPFVRMTAVSALGRLRPDPQVGAILRRIAAFDPDRGGDPNNPKYRVRELASEALARFDKQ